MNPPPLPVSAYSVESWRFIEAGGNTTHSFGLGRLCGKIFCLLYLSPEPVSLEEIATRLGVSKASASIVVRQLFEFQAVRQVSFPGDRRDYYEAETDFMRTVKNGIMPSVRKKLATAALQIERTLKSDAPAIAPLPQQGSASSSQQAEIQRRLRHAQALHRRIDRLLGSKMLSRFL